MRVLGLRWRRGGRRLLDVPSLHMEGPGLVLLVGASGSGKSSLLRALSGALAGYHAGDIEGRIEHRLHGEDRRLRLGYVPQDPMDGFLGFDAETEVQLRLQAAGATRKEALAATRAKLDTLQLQDRERVPIQHLSGGERKRLSIRSALLNAPHLLLLDEPLTGLDEEWRANVLEDILGAAETALVVAAVHDIDHWMPLASSLVLVDAGRVAWRGSPDGFEAVRDDWPSLRRRPPGFVPPPRHESPDALVATNLAAIRGRPLFRELDLRLPTGLHAITGPNGCGKSTLLRILSGLEAPDEGRVRFEHWDVADLAPWERAAFIAYHFEEPARTFFLASVLDELLFQPRNARRTEFEAESDARRASNLLRTDPMLDQHPYTLSGGEQERVALACVDAARPRLVLLDEPTHGLDSTGREDLVALLERHRRNACIVLATHDPELIRRADTVHRFDGERLLQIRLGGTSRFVEVVPRRPS